MRKKQTFGQAVTREMTRNWDLYLLLVPVLAYFLIFCYYPMYGAQIAFRDYRATRGIWGSEWVGLEHFVRFFKGAYASRLLLNTFLISAYSLVAGFPLPIILAIMLNEINSRWFKKTVQLVTYAPYFLSSVVMVGLITAFLSLDSGLVNQVIKALGGEPTSFLNQPKLFKAIYVISGLWQGTGYGSIIYLAALSSIDVTLYEAAIVDGASRWQRICKITFPCILPTTITMLILSMGSLMSVGFDKVFLLQNDFNISSSDVISTYVYKAGLQRADFSFASAVGLFNSAISFVLVIAVNFIAKKVSDTSLF